MPPLTVMIKPASSLCNSACRYCFYSSEAASRRTPSYGMMSDETAEKIIRRAYEYAEGSCSFIFQGGEPTLRGLDFFCRFTDTARKFCPRGVKTALSIQTNGLLIDGDWARFLADNGFLTGLSLDGPAEIHDRNRADRNGKSTYNRVRAAADTLARHGVEFNILSVVTSESSRSPDKLYNFFKRSGFRFLQFIPCLDPHGCAPGGQPYSLTPQRYGRFLVQMFDRWYADYAAGTPVSIRYFDNLLMMLRGMPPEACCQSGRCRAGVVVEADGSVFPCDFYMVDEWRLGNVHTDSIADMLASDTARRFEAASDPAPECLDCRVYSLCRGGCRRERDFGLSLGSGAGPSYFCPAYRLLFEHIQQTLFKAKRPL